MTNPNKLADALRLFLVSKAEIQAKFDSHGPDDLAALLRKAYLDAGEALAEHDAQPAQGEWVLVPRVPTGEMVQYGFDAMRADNVRDSSEQGRVRRIYGAMLARAPQPAPAPVQGAKRDREADRVRFPDAQFNAWLDDGISDCGHTVWDTIGDVCDAWHGWSAREFYAHPPAPAADGAGELPPLPAAEYRLSPDSRQPSLYDEDAMRAYARAAIAALRQPVQRPRITVEMIDTALQTFTGDLSLIADGIARQRMRAVMEYALASQQESRNAD